MSDKRPATIDNLYAIPGKAEIVDDELMVMEPTGGLPGYAASQVTVSLSAYARQTQKGVAIGDNVGFVVNLPHRKSFCPDAAYHVGKLTMKFVDGAPIFAVEVRSENDYGPRAEKEMARKRADYFAAGTQVVWDVDLQNPLTVRVFRKTDPQNPTLYARGELAEAEPAVPGWRMPVSALLPS